MINQEQRVSGDGIRAFVAAVAEQIENVERGRTVRFGNGRTGFSQDAQQQESSLDEITTVPKQEIE